MLKLIVSENKKLTQHQTEMLHRYVSVFALCLTASFVVYIFWQLVKPREDFYNELWVPAYLLTQGKSPYDTSSLSTNLPAAWFPMAIGFFFPIGLLPENFANKTWFIFSVIEICTMIYVVQGKKLSMGNTTLLALLVFFFPPVLNHFNLGQISVTVTLCLIFAVYFTNKNRHWMTAFLIALAFSKPHLAMLAGLGLSYHYWNKKSGGVFPFWGKIFVTILVLCIPLFIAHPNWIPDAITSMTKNPFWPYPSLFILFQRYFGARGYAVWGLVVVLVVRFFYFLWKNLALENAMYWSIALAPMITPYVGSWDFVVLLPLFIKTFILADQKRKILLVIFYGIAWYGMAVIQLRTNGHDSYYWWVPVCFIGVIALVTDWTTLLADKDTQITDDEIPNG